MGLIIKHDTMNKIQINVTKAIKLDGRTSNTGRPTNDTSARQVRLGKQKAKQDAMDYFMGGGAFTYGNQVYHYSTNALGGFGCIVDNATHGHVVNVESIGRTKVVCYTFVMGKQINVTIDVTKVKHFINLK